MARMIALAALLFFAAVMALASSPSFAANICKAERLSCATTMPVGGYCQCTSRGMTQDGEVVAPSTRNSRTNAASGGCGATPNVPGCR